MLDLFRIKKKFLSFFLFFKETNVIKKYIYIYIYIFGVIESIWIQIGKKQLRKTDKF